MSATLALTGKQHAQLKSHLFPGDGKEAAALALCGRRAGSKRYRLVVHEIIPVPYEICRRAVDRISWPVEWMDETLERAAAKGWSVVKFHSHPTDYRRFSEADDASDAAHFPAVHALVEGGIPHASVIMLPDGELFGRTVGSAGEFTPLDHIAVAGDDVLIWRHDRLEIPECAADVGRKTLAFGAEMTRDLAGLTIAVVGCSGTGSIVIEQLARLGVGRLIIVDPERVESKNLNRIVNATRQDADERAYKVSVAKSAIESMRLGSQVDEYPGNIVSRRAVEAVAEADVIFGCVDSAEGRDVLNRISTYYLIPYIDVGVDIRALDDGTIDTIDGVIHYIQPDQSSLLDREAYRPEQVSADALRRRDPELYAERVREKYIRGAQEEAPAVVSVNMTMASMAVNELLARLYKTRNEPNQKYACSRINLAEMEIEKVAESGTTSSLPSSVGKGDASPPIGLPELSVES